MGKHGLGEDEVADLKEAFSMFDIDGDGTFFSVRVGGEDTCRCTLQQEFYIGLISIHLMRFVPWVSVVAESLVV